MVVFHVTNVLQSGVDASLLALRFSFFLFLSVMVLGLCMRRTR